MRSGPDDRARVVATTVAAPWGPVHLAATARGIAAVELMTTHDAFAAGLGRRLRARIQWIAADTNPASDTDMDARTSVDVDVDVDALRHLQAAATALADAARGGQASHGDPDGSGDEDADALARLPLDLEDRPAWDRAVLDAVRAIPRGETRSYGEIARAIGRPGAGRAVGGAVGRNPVGFLVPCHRVIAGDGTLGGYGGGWWGDHERLLDLKAELLAREGIVLRRSLPRGLPRRSRGR